MDTERSERWIGKGIDTDGRNLPLQYSTSHDLVDHGSMSQDFISTLQHRNGTSEYVSKCCHLVPHGLDSVGNLQSMRRGGLKGLDIMY